VHIKWWNAI